MMQKWIDFVLYFSMIFCGLCLGGIAIWLLIEFVDPIIFGVCSAVTVAGVGAYIWAFIDTKGEDA